MHALSLVLLPGLDGTGSLLAQFQEALLPQHASTVVRYPADPAAGYAALERVVRASLPAEGSYVLLAESFSGPIALSIAARPPPGLVALVLACSFARNPRPLLTPLAFRYARRPPPSMAHYLLGVHAAPALRERVADVLHALDVDLIRARLGAIRDVDVRSVLPRVRMPVLYLQAAFDRIVPRRALEVLALGLPALAIRRIPGPHFLLQTAPAECAREVAHFLRIRVVPTLA